MRSFWGKKPEVLEEKEEGERTVSESRREKEWVREDGDLDLRPKGVWGKRCHGRCHGNGRREKSGDGTCSKEEANLPSGPTGRVLRPREPESPRMLFKPILSFTETIIEHLGCVGFMPPGLWKPSG